MTRSSRRVPRSGDRNGIPDGQRYAAACPGTTGYVELNRPDLIGWDPPLEDRTPNTDDNFTAATGVTWMTSIGAVTLAPDVVSGGERTVTEPASASAARAPLGLTGSSITPADQHVAVVKDPAAQQIRWLTLHADDSTAYDAMRAWGEAAKLASGTAVAGPPDLMSTYAVTSDGDDLLIVQTLTDQTGALYVGRGHLGGPADRQRPAYGVVHQRGQGHAGQRHRLDDRRSGTPGHPRQRPVPLHRDRLRLSAPAASPRPVRLR